MARKVSILYPRGYPPIVVGKQLAPRLDSLDGNDPVSMRPFVRQVIEGLTGPLSEDDIQGLPFERSTPRLMEPDEMISAFAPEDIHIVVTGGESQPACFMFGGLFRGAGGPNQPMPIDAWR